MTDQPQVGRIEQLSDKPMTFQDAHRKAMQTLHAAEQARTPQPCDGLEEYRKSRKQRILDGITNQNEPAEWEGRKGFWVQADCAFIEGLTPEWAIQGYREKLAKFDVGCSHNFYCSALRQHVPDDAANGALQQQAEEIERLKAERNGLRARLREVCEWGLVLTNDPQFHSHSNIGSLRAICERHLYKCDEALNHD